MNKKLYIILSFSRKYSIQLIVFLIAFWDIRTELKIFIDHPTVMSVLFAIKHHLLAFTIIFFSPFLFQSKK